jgi:hypothetical protein
MTIGFKLLVFTNINSNIIGFIQASIDFLVCNVAVNLVIREFHESPQGMVVVSRRLLRLKKTEPALTVGEMKSEKN